jgi:hypothetical protein
MPTYSLPPATRSVGTGNPPQDMDDVVNVLTHSLFQRVFYIDQYGADPTGAASSDAAWTACYADAVAAVQTQGGSMVVFGAGNYKFSMGTVAINDPRIGLRGQGRRATTITTTGNTGTLVKITGTATGSTAPGAAPVSGFTCYGWSAGNSSVGVEYGDRYGGNITDVSSVGFGGTASMGFWFHDATSLSEGSYIQVLADQNTDDFVFQGNASTGSFDYSHIILKCVSTTQGGSSGAVLKVIGHMQLNGCYIQLSGNISATTGLTKTCVVIGNSGSDVSCIIGSQLNIMVEADTSAGTVKDVTITGASGFGINLCTGVMYFQNISGTYTAGSVTAPAVFKVSGMLNGPLFSGAGTLGVVTTSPTTAGQGTLAVYVG